MRASGIYTGIVAHKRLRPKRHKLSYRVFSLLLDLDELPRLSLRWLAVNRAGLLSFRESDHGDGGPLRPWVAARLAEAGIEADGPVRMLCYPRMLGYVFNPLTVYYCYRADGTLAAIIHEVHNTHGERHAYVLPGGEGTVRHSCAKTFFVSPFMPMDCIYHFTITPPGDSVSVGIVEGDAEGTLLTATFSGQRSELTDAALLRAVLTHPLMTLKVTAAIHWEAVKLLLKGLRVYPHKPRRAS
ncbi:MAG: DUF1365 domain-containing protein [Devosia sp.]